MSLIRRTTEDIYTLRVGCKPCPAGVTMHLDSVVAMADAASLVRDAGITYETATGFRRHTAVLGRLQIIGDANTMGFETVRGRCPTSGICGNGPAIVEISQQIREAFPTAVTVRRQPRIS